MRKTVSSILAVSLLLLCSIAVSAQMSMVGEVVDVVDGKTVVIAVPTGRITAELQFIDVPDASQQYGGIVKDHLSKLVLGRSVNYLARTLYQTRTVGRLMVKDTDISMQMLRDGAAWHIPQNISSQPAAEFETYAATERDARKEKRGVWSSPKLRPSWESSPGSIPVTMSVANSFASESGSATAGSQSRRGYWSDTDPSLGSVGVLGHGYNAEAKSGYVSTYFLGVKETDAETERVIETAIDFTYFYKDSPDGKRKRMFVLTIISESPRWRFLEHNDLTILADDKRTPVGKPKRTTETLSGAVFEKLTYQIDRATLDKIVNGSDVSLKVGAYIIVPRTGLQMLLYTMLQVP